MNSFASLTTDFLNQKRIAVVGVSSKRNTPANGIYRKLKELNYDVFAVNRSGEPYENDPCYPDLQSVPSTIDGVVIVTNAENSEKVVEQCVALNIARVWMHCSAGTVHRVPSENRRGNTSSVSGKAIRLCREHNIAVIPGACPMMFCESADWWHKFMRRVLSFTGKLRVE